MAYENIERCRVCGAEDLQMVLDLGLHPLANALKGTPDQKETEYPLTLLFCRQCSLVQIRETINKELLFQNYIWVTGTSSTALDFAYDFFNKLRSLQPFGHGDVIIEIASNDGTFLKPFIEEGLNAIGIDSAHNIAAMANDRGIKTINAFWNETIAERIVQEYGYAKAIFARNVIPHVSQLHDVISGMALCLCDDGIGAIEFHYAGNILKQLQYDAIYHEHLCYFTIETLRHLLTMHHLHPFHVDLSPISGGAYIVYFRKYEALLSENYTALMTKEKSMEFNETSCWESFGMRCHTHRKKSLQILESFSPQSIIGFGASARSSTYLNFCGLTNGDFRAIIDNNELKRGLYTPGSTIPIVSFDGGMDMNPEIMFVLAWNFKDEIVNRCRKKGYNGKFLIPFPDPPYLI